MRLLESMDEMFREHCWLNGHECEQTLDEEPGVLQSMGSQKIGHDLLNEQHQQPYNLALVTTILLKLSSSSHKLTFSWQFNFLIIPLSSFPLYKKIKPMEYVLLLIIFKSNIDGKWTTFQVQICGDIVLVGLLCIFFLPIYPVLGASQVAHW